MIDDEFAMSTKESSRKTSLPQVVKLDNAFKLAEKWVCNMSKPAEDESPEVEMASRPPRLGLGAAVPCQFRAVLSNDPVERKLRSKLDAERKKVAKNTEHTVRDEGMDHDSGDDDELESKAKAFTKKRTLSFVSHLQAKKKK